MQPERCAAWLRNDRPSCIKLRSGFRSRGIAIDGRRERCCYDITVVPDGARAWKKLKLKLDLYSAGSSFVNQPTSKL